MDLNALAAPVLIQTRDGLAELIRDLSGQSGIAVDTESNSLHAYHERVCLIQFSTLETDYILDPLALDDLQALAPIFSNPFIEKVFHASEYDLICLRRDYDFSFSHIFDTMQAGRILGRKQAGLDRLLEEKFSVKMNKRYQKADWAVRPLSRDLLLYARLDTHYLLPLRDLLKADLEEHGVGQLAQEDFQMACNPNGSKPKPEMPAWMRFSARRDLTPRDLTVLNELLSWREKMAERMDRPPFKVMDDDRLIEIVKTKPTTADELAEIGLGSKQLESWGGQLIEAVASGEKLPLLQPVRAQRPDAPYLKRLEKLKDWRKKTAAKMDVESDVVLPRPLLLALVEHGAKDAQSVMAPSPWRWQQFGDQILNVLLETP